MKNLVFTLVFFFFAFKFYAQDQNPTFSKVDVLSDLDYLYNSLIDAHYDAFAYVSQEDFMNNYLEVKNSLNKENFTRLEVTNAFQKVISAINNGHTEIDFPGADYGNFIYGGGKLFPLEIAFENGKSLVRKNFSKNPDIKVGAEVLKINGETMDAVLAKIYPQVSAERIYFKNAKIELYSFPRFYWQVFGQQDHFEIEILQGERIESFKIDAIKGIDDYEAQRSEVANAQMKLNFFKDAAYINPGNFGGDEPKYQHFIDSSFTEIKKQKSTNLIIDLRNNLGGNDSFSDYLVSYIANKPFKWSSDYTLKTSEFLKNHTRKHYDTLVPFFAEILKHKSGEVYPYHFEDYIPKPMEDRFKGKVYVLVNRQSHSQAAVTAAQIQDYGFGTIVGEETGDYPSLFASQFQYALPKTGIIVKVAKGRIVRVNGSAKKEGVIPDIKIQDHLLDENDEILDGVLKKINTI